MEKISKIVPMSARMRSINVSRSQAARPGAPEYGRAPAKSDLAEQLTELGVRQSPTKFSEDRMSFSGLEDSKPLYKKPNPQAKIVDEINQKFNFVKQEAKLSKDLPVDVVEDESIVVD